MQRIVFSAFSGKNYFCSAAKTISALTWMDGALNNKGTAAHQFKSD
jgi:hypothetical protein